MADGHLNKCIDCAKTDNAERLEKLMMDPEFADKERERQRLKQQRARANGTATKSTGANKSAINKRHALKYPEKTRARHELSNAVRDGHIQRKPCKVCASPDSEAHHENYSKPLDVVWLCPKHHAERHLQIRKARRKAA